MKVSKSINRGRFNTWLDLFKSLNGRFVKDPIDNGRSVYVRYTYAPDYNKQCCNCGASPVVAILEGEKIVNELEMCGPCVFGDAACIEPSEWN